MDNKTVLITGGASGLGKTISKYLASRGCNLVICYNTSEEKAIELKKELEVGSTITIIKCDLSSEEEIKNMVSILHDKNIKIDYLVNNAAVCYDSLYEDKTKELMMKTFEVNTVGTFLLSRLVADEMYKNKYGAIVNISSTNGINKYFPMTIDYDASKAALNSITHNLSLEYAPYVRVNAVAPGWVKTENEMKDLDIDYIKSEEDKIFVRRFAEELEIAKVVGFLLSDDASYINNQIISVDGGTY